MLLYYIGSGKITECVYNAEWIKINVKDDRSEPLMDM